MYGEPRENAVRSRLVDENSRWPVPEMVTVDGSLRPRSLKGIFKHRITYCGGPERSRIIATGELRNVAIIELLIARLVILPVRPIHRLRTPG